jgi:hypothetical protein
LVLHDRSLHGSAATSGGSAVTTADAPDRSFAKNESAIEGVFEKLRAVKGGVL